MKDYQKQCFDLFADFRPKPTYPTYPPYHVGKYLEDQFIHDFITNDIDYDRIFIPVSWTTVYVENKTVGLQEALNSLNPDLKYFVVAQHDDFPLHQLPADTKIFSASQHTPKDIIPIPVICSPIGKTVKEKDILVSFVGSITHPIREKVINTCHSIDDFYFSAKSWSGTVDKSSLDKFIYITSRSRFTLCPRGYGNTSFRLYECMQLGSIPVYISDDFCLPWKDEIDWSEFCVLVHESEIDNLKNILYRINDMNYNKMIDRISTIYNKYFTLETLYKNITNRV